MSTEVRLTVQRPWSLAAVVLGLGTIVLAVVVFITNFPRGLTVLACAVAGGRGGLVGDSRRRAPRAARWDSPALLLAGAVALIVSRGHACSRTRSCWSAFAAALDAAREALKPRARWPRAQRPERPVLFYNPKSGGGKAERFHLADEARRRGIEPIELQRGRRSRDARARRGRARGRRARDGRRRRLAGDRGQGRRRARPALRLHPGGHAQPLRAGSRRRPRRRGRRARRLRRRRRAASSTSPRSTAACSSTTCRSASTPRPCSAPGTARPSCTRCSTRCPRCSARSGGASTCAGPARTAASSPAARHPRLQQPLPARARDRVGHAAAAR